MTTTGDVGRMCECVNADVRKCRCAIALKRRAAAYIPEGGEGAGARPGGRPEVAGTIKRPRRMRGRGRLIKGIEPLSP
jgi:hypothetical protein